MSATETVTVESRGLTLSLIVWRRFKRPTPGLVEKILDTNPGLAALGAVLPVGTVFTMPIESPAAAAAHAKRLW